MFEIQEQDGGVFRLAGRFDAARVDEARAVLEAAHGEVTLDLAELDYIASAGISVVLALFKRLHTEGGALRLVRPTPHVRNVFHYAGLDQILNLEDA